MTVRFAMHTYPPVSQHQKTVPIIEWPTSLDFTSHDTYLNINTHKNCGDAV